MNTKTEYIDSRTGERVTRIDHFTGLTIYVWPKKGYQSCYAVCGTRYGSVDTVFDIGGVRTEVPAGIAHYLEHKLFENEDCDAFQQYAKTGASANAFTSFDKTAYLFSCTGEIGPSLEILLRLVQNPWFTEENVEKERGIIGQEIKMYEDSPGWRVFFNLLRCMYSRHPVRTDIAGTVESIAAITPQLLYGCYNAFYNLHNMVLAAVGNLTPEEIEEAADRLLKPAAPFTLARADAGEPAEVATPFVTEKMEVAAPLFYFGYKLPVAGAGCLNAADSAAFGALLELLAGHASPLYTRLLAEGLINPKFGMEVFDGPGYAALLFTGESRDPAAVAAAIREEAARVSREGFDPDAVIAVRNALYGDAVMSLSEVEDCGDALMNAHFRGEGPFAEIDAAASLTKEAVEALLPLLDPEKTALSVIEPL